MHQCIEGAGDEGLLHAITEEDDAGLLVEDSLWELSFSSSGMAGACGEAVESWGKHLANSASAHSAGTVAPVELVPTGA